VVAQYPSLEEHSSGMIFIKPNTAISFIGVGLAVWLLQLKMTDPRQVFLTADCHYFDHIE